MVFDLVANTVNQVRQSMDIRFDPVGDIDGLDRCLKEVGESNGCSGLLVLCAAGNGFSDGKIDKLLRQVSLPLIGGIFPSIVYGNDVFELGTIVVGLDQVIHTQTIGGLSDRAVDFEPILEEYDFSRQEVKTLILFVDGFASRINDFVEGLFTVFGLNFNYIGGGAGSLSMERKPYLLTNEGVRQDCAVLAFLASDSGVGVCHGWRELTGPYQVTESDRNAINTIEWQPAFTFYRDLVEKHTGHRVSRNDFYDIAQNYPFGIARLDGEHIVRDPYQVGADDSLLCIGEIANGAFLSILTAEKENLIEAAGKSLQRARQAFPEDKEGTLSFFVDCISRSIVLTDDFPKELNAVYRPELPLVGVCSVGEIANSGTEYLELYNKTSVLAVLE